jgi:hypothetical protein
LSKETIMRKYFTLFLLCMALLSVTMGSDVTCDIFGTGDVDVD